MIFQPSWGKPPWGISNFGTGVLVGNKMYLRVSKIPRIMMEFPNLKVIQVVIPDVKAQHVINMSMNVILGHFYPLSSVFTVMSFRDTKPDWNVTPHA